MLHVTRGISRRYFQYQKHTVEEDKTLLYDTFTGDDYTLLTSHTPDVCPQEFAYTTGKVSLSGSLINSLEIFSNRCYVKSTASIQSLNLFDLGIADFKLSADVTFTETYTSAFSFLFRYQDGGNYWTASFSKSLGGIYFIQRVSDVYTWIDEGHAVVPDQSGKTYSISLTISGDNFSFVATDTEGNSYTCNHTSSIGADYTKVGINPARNTGGTLPHYLDNLRVESL